MSKYQFQKKLSFQDSFEKQLKTGQKRIFHVEDGAFSMSLSLKATPISSDDEQKRFKLEEIVWAEILTDYGIQSVCRQTGKYAPIYNLTKNILEVDCTLSGNYTHDDDGLFSQKLKDFFGIVPSVIPKTHATT